LLRAFRQVVDASPIRLVIAGDGPERGALQRLSAELGLNERVDFFGQLDDPAPFYRSLDVFALSSDTEQMPLSVIEAMAAGLPIAATNVGDIAGMLSDANLPFVTVPDDAGLAGAIRALTKDPLLRQRVGAANQAKAAAEFGQARMLAAWCALFDGRLPTA
jgi:glycosyltransferase involved in cell wall biosynthesis